MENTLTISILSIALLVSSLGWFFTHLKFSRLSSVIESIRNGKSLENAMEDYGVARDSQGRLKPLAKKGRLTTHA